MDDQDRLRRDTATIVRIIKYLLIMAIVLLGVYFGLRMVVILLPLIIGFILAETSITLANQLHRLTRHWAEYSRHPGASRRNRRDADALQKAAAEDSTAEDKAAGTASGRYVAHPRRPLIGKWPERTRPAITIYVLIVILFFALMAGILFIAFSQLRSLTTYLTAFFARRHVADELVASLHSFLLQMSGGLMTDATINAVQSQIESILRDLVQRIPSLLTSLVNRFGEFVADLPIILFTLVVVIMSGYYFISDSKSVTAFVRRNVPHTSFREKTGRLITTLGTKLFRIMGGYLLLFMFTFAVSLVGLVLIRMPYALVFALVAAFVDFLPVLGIGATMTPIAIYMFLNGSVWGAIGAAATGIVITVVRRVIEPPILGGAMQLHPLATLFAMIVGVGLYGLLGLLIGPVVLVIGTEVLTLYGFDTRLRSLVAELLAKFSD